MNRVTGRYERSQVAGEEVRAFVPAPLPPHDPPLALEGDLAALHRRAEVAVGRLELAAAMVPSVEWFLYSFVRKEAVISSQIEGTEATLMDLLSFEASARDSAVETRDVQEVCNYLEALTHARQQMADPAGLPLSVRLLNEAHRRLMNGARGEGRRPGEIRRSQNWIGGTRPGNAAHVPPPPHAVAELLGQLETWLHAASDLPPLVRAGLAHVQFEAIHPYLDGNGRIGRLLVTLLLEHPIVSVATALDLLHTTRPTATKAVTALVDAGVLVEVTGRRRDRTFRYEAYLERLRAGTELEGRR